MKECIIVIPIHSEEPSRYELISFEQCFKILGNHPIKIVAPKGLDVSNYKKVVADFDIIHIDTKWQETILAYNKLKVSRFFYKLFSDYEYLLTYELDAFVFKDDLLFWCQQGYDYIGAPWFEGHVNDHGENKMMAVGNSGFSLRRISTIQEILKKTYYIHQGYTKMTIWEKLWECIKFPALKIASFGKENMSIQVNFRTHEDGFFSSYIAFKYPKFKIATVQQATDFSFEVSPEVMFQFNNERLPFGCHAWWRYNIEFWRPHIENFGYKL